MRHRYTARLVRKQLLSDPQQCFHLEFAVDGTASFEFLPGQFVSVRPPQQPVRPLSEQG
jgi:NAD(P)H-flavin reductase